jgi:serine/threonine protein kinase
MLRDIDHPFVVRLHSSFQNDDKVFLLMDFVPGGDLRYHLNRQFALPEIAMKMIAAEVVLALEYLHSKDILYRDLKPENIMMDMDGHIRLVDFGLAVNFKPTQKTGDKAANKQSCCGTLEYVGKPDTLVHPTCHSAFQLTPLISTSIELPPILRCFQPPRCCVARTMIAPLTGGGWALRSTSVFMATFLSLQTVRSESSTPSITKT